MVDAGLYLMFFVFTYSKIEAPVNRSRQYVKKYNSLVVSPKH